MLGLRPQRPCCKPSVWGNCDHDRKKAWYSRSCTEDCIEHELAHHWHKITKDSWIVDARLILGPAGAAAYLTKYLVKAFDNRRELFRRGFVRRWSCSNNWPSPARLQLAVTVAGGWDTVNFMGKKSIMRETLLKEVQASKEDGWAVRVGSDMAEAFEAKRKRHKLRKFTNLIYDGSP